ncbi:MAG: ACP S-malonyltransferase [Planctomycetota bacterium]|nr:MAG: ACP S-malonyltransferase [Planctomycetota bacterium]RLS49457.1 MAG: ACP S-malonyltransferase [Planctomycetota bacterium]RLS53070.1 MAG: ACP S-malonyltransferase [Planctomycetota bacterium]HAQ66946.1 [acyl-carrier-protein] S-malonyltransferase [Phycisphaerales bacterium]
MSAISNGFVFLCPGQGAQTVGMGKTWVEFSPAAASVYQAADEITSFGARRLSEFCFAGPQEELNRTDISQPALFTCGMACHSALLEKHPAIVTVAANGLSLGEYTALCIAGAFSFADGLRLVATRGRLMQQAAEASRGGMVALIGADETQANEVCAAAAKGEVLVPANFNAPGQIVVSGSVSACDRAVEVASTMGLRAAKLAVAGAFHSPLMASAAEGMARALEHVELKPLSVDVWSNVTGLRHHRNDPARLRKLLVEQIVSPVRWSQSCTDMIGALKGGEIAGGSDAAFHELAPNTVLKGLMRRIDRSTEVHTHDQHDQPQRDHAVQTNA